MPRVRSTLVRLRFHPPDPPPRDRAVFEAVSHAIFTRRRKTLANALKPVADSVGRSAAELIERAKVDAGKRPEALTLDDFARLARAML